MAGESYSRAYGVSIVLEAQSALLSEWATEDSRAAEHMPACSQQIPCTGVTEVKPAFWMCM